MTYYRANHGAAGKGESPDSGPARRAAPRALPQKLRLDPCHLPQSLCYKGRGSGARFTALLTERGVIVRRLAAQAAAPAAEIPAAAKAARRRAKSLMPHILSLRQFRGIAACKITAADETLFCLMLLHDQDDYCVPLLLSADKDDVLLDWRLWADCYNLPMLIEDAPAGGAAAMAGGGRSFRPLSGAAACRLFINDGRMRRRPREFFLRCRGLSLNMRLVLANQVMLG